MAVKPVVLCLSRSGEPTAQKIAKAMDLQLHGGLGRVDIAAAYFPDTLEHIRSLFASGTPIIGICACGILIRAVAPLLINKHNEPPVLAVSDDGNVVVPLLGGHRGANKLAKQISDITGGLAAITTAGDVTLGVALDDPPIGYRLANPEHAKPVMAAILGGAGVKLTGENLFEIPADKNGTFEIHVTDKPAEGTSTCLVYHPKRFALGLGCARGADPDELWDLVTKSLDDAGIAKGAIASVNSIDLKGDEPAIIKVAQRLDVPFRLFTSDELEEKRDKLANPSDVVFAEVGCHGVSEAAALAASNDAAVLVIEKQKTANCTCAVSRTLEPILHQNGRSRGKLSIIGIGPGQHSWRTPQASQLIAQSDELVGYGLYIDLLGPLAVGKIRTDFPLGGEEERCRYALEQAGKGKNIALICSGDAGIYAMAALVFELLDRGPDACGVSDAARRIEVISAPGVSALQGAAARAGAPLGHDFCAISLSDLLTPREDILKRLKAAAEGDFVIAFYNPVSKRRRTLLAEARDILLQHRPANTPVMLASSLGRPEENIRYRKLSDLKVDEVDMLTVVLVGSSHSRLAKLGEGPRMFTPRGYARKIDGDLS